MFNQNIYNNIPGNFTFQSVCYVPPPPAPPPFFLPPVFNSNNSDQEYVRKFEKDVSKPSAVKTNKVSISAARDKVQKLDLALHKMVTMEKWLNDNMSCAVDEWNSKIQDIDKYKIIIAEGLAQINDSYLNTPRQLLAKRSAKRARMKRVRFERKIEKQNRIRELEERSRKIDENLQKINDDINKAKQDEDSKIHTDLVLKEVLRKKHDAKKCIVKLDALKKLRKARQNTATGRGDSVSERDTTTFNSNIDKLKSLWTQKLSTYEEEESELRGKLKVADEQSTPSEQEKRDLDVLAKWREFLFGDTKAMPQMDFQGDIARFVAVRSQWDHYLSEEGSPMPVGWVVPRL